MKISVIGGGAWGTTLAQVLNDNGNDVLIYEINQDYIKLINDNHIHPIFENKLNENILATNDLKKAVLFSNVYVLAVPTRVIRSVLKKINQLMVEAAIFINVSKGIEPETLKLVSQITEEEIQKDKFNGFVSLTGPSHAEEVIERKLTLLVSSSKNKTLSKEVQKMFSNEKYMRVYTSSDLIGCEVGAAVKNAIAVISGMCTGIGLGENARAAIITRGILEIIRVVEFMGGIRKTAFGLTGIGDLIVTASSENSRNFQGGKKLGEGLSVDEIYQKSTQTIEGFRTIYALNKLANDNNIDLPLISTAHKVLEKMLTVKDAMRLLLKRELKAEDF